SFLRQPLHPPRRHSLEHQEFTMNDRDARLDWIPGDIGDEFGSSYFNSLHRRNEETVRKLLGLMGRRKRAGGQATPLLPGPEARGARRAEAHGGAPARPAAPRASAQEKPMRGPDTPPVERAGQVWGLPRWLALVVDDRFVLD